MAYDSKEDVLKLSEIDPELDEFLKANPLPKPSYDDPLVYKENSKERYRLLFGMLGPPPPGVTQEDTSYQTRDGYTNRARIYRPATSPANGSPLVLLIHGGGFVIGVPESEEQSARNLVQAFGATVVNIAYRLAPEFPFPYAVNDCWDGLQWAASSAAAWGADPKAGFIVGGTSAGGNISAVLAHKARDENLTPPLTGQWLSIPAVLPLSQVPEKYKDMYLSWEQNEFAPVLPRALIDMFMNAYNPDPADAENYSVFNHPKGHRGLPKAYFQVDGLDPLRDEGLIYERVLRTENDVPTKLDVYPGLPHGHWSFFPNLKGSKKFREDQVNGFGWLLGKEPKLADPKVGASTA